MYVYESPIGLMVIKYNKSTNIFSLTINSNFTETYDSAIAAADNVYMHVTGYYDWDKLDGEINDVPTDIYEWKKIL